MTGIHGRHWRAVIGLILMAMGVAGYVTVIFGLGIPIEHCRVELVCLLRQYGFPGMLFIGGYNLFQRGALADIAAAWRMRKP